MEDNNWLKEKENIIERGSAILLKELGFKEPVFDFFTTVNNSLYFSSKRDCVKNNFNSYVCHNKISAPTKEQVQLWFIKNYDVHISSKKNPTRNKINENSIFALNLEKTLKKLLKNHNGKVVRI